MIPTASGRRLLTSTQRKARGSEEKGGHTTKHNGGTFHVYIHIQDDVVRQKLDQIYSLLKAVKAEEDLIMPVLDDLTSQVTANTDTEASAIQLLNNIHALLVAAGTDPVKLGALKDTLKTSGDALAAAIVANTPAATP